MLLSAAPALARSDDPRRESAEDAVETINLEESEVTARKRGPKGEHITATQRTKLESLIEIRESFTDEMAEVAESL